ncbi:MAG: 1-deoxy-D-xylulose-5-phosphate reductoisomerase, partial [Peptostreptococcales bacterium]
MKKIGLLGSTGSIGTQALEVIRNNKDKFEVVFLTAGKNRTLLEKQIKEFHPKVVAIAGEEDASLLKEQFKGLEVLHGMEGIIEAAKSSECQLVLNALVGMMGLLPTEAAIKAGKDIALANKETLVVGGSVIMTAGQQYNVKILPVDSEHSAIFQCLQGNYHNPIKRIILTASGGPFRGYSLLDLEKVSLEDALKHPNWNMGHKVTIDSASLMNKGLEVIEAYHLFHVAVDQIHVVVHPESIVHSLVEFEDHSVMAQMGLPDMKVPIQYAFTYPDRIKNNLQPLDLAKIGSLTFEEPDLRVFENLKLAYEALKAGESYCILLNAANEVLVDLFLKRQIQFLDIQNTIKDMMHS